MPSLNHVHPFLFEHLDIRGAIVSLDSTWRSLLAGRGYPPAVANLLGEMSAVTTLIGANLKQPGRMTFQLRGEGPVNLLVLDCDEQLRLRGMAHWRPEALHGQLLTPDLLGHGQLALTLDTAGMRQPYQSLVPLVGDSIAAIFEHYLSQSEQQPTRLMLAAGPERAVGLFLQKLPSADARDADGWNRIQHMLATLRAPEMLGQAPVDLLRRVFPEEDVRVYPPRPVSHHCPEDWEKVQNMLRSFGRAECDAILREKGEIVIRDDICNHNYRLDGAAVAALFEPPSPTLH
ncbi:MAG: Hsp33 family molecular chaperone HslO [Pseudomonadota bacterium]|nr:Hsp33 family molecular chaperone HslO [Pseudomonadota bacterium]MDP1572993.1 Hsp33 family molecular chaperone HslO [Pseudomonadota bacterium]MDP1903151.1 Hsp33 family molecular chaperone HslO [Pseudomonadota bacterium]